MARERTAELRLLVEIDPNTVADGSPELVLEEGRRWAINTFPLGDGDSPSSPVPKYICVSYIWGEERTANPYPFGPAQLSTNTLPALRTAMQGLTATALWIDAFCIPTQQPSKTLTLESMGFIYSRAATVRVVLSPASYAAIQQLSPGDRLDDAAVATLEQDAWVRSVWTYQEVVNSQRLEFLSPAGAGQVVQGSHFLNGLGFSLQHYKEARGLDSMDMRRQLPGLDAFEDLIADWMIAAYTERSALSVMSAMDARTWVDRRNYFYAMIGAVSSAPSRRSATGVVDLAEVFMAICEAKGDFSFIFSSAPRSQDMGRKWRPAGGQTLPAILPWHCWGEGQPGRFDDEGRLWLEDVAELQPAVPSTQALRHIATWLQWPNDSKLDTESLIDAAYRALRGMSFTGSKNAESLADGLFFAQTALPPSQGVNFIVSTRIRWTLGAPGLAVVPEDQGFSFVPGVFFGIISEGRAQSACLKLAKSRATGGTRKER